MKRDRLLCIVIAAALGQLACAAAPPPSVANASASTRFGTVEDVVLADSAEAKATAEAPRIPRFPPDMKAAGTEAGFGALFVLDTAGRVEYRTVSFTAGAAWPFRDVVCSILREARYTPVVRDGVPRRALMITSWTFGLEGGTWYNRRYDVQPLRRAIVAEGLPSAVARLETQPHC